MSSSRTTAGAVVLAAILATAGCGASSSRTSEVTERVPTTASTAATAPLPTQTYDGRTATSTTARGVSGAGVATTGRTITSPSGGAPIVGASASARGPLCRAGALSLRYLGQQGAAGHGELGFALRNTSGVPCHSAGYPGVAFLGDSGTPLPTVTKRSTQDIAGSTPVSPLTLAPGASMSFRLVVSHISSAPCQTAKGVQVIPPDDTAILRVEVPDGAYECGSADVSPVQAGEGAFR